jgi:SH3-like domain-containing protein
VAKQYYFSFVRPKLFIIAIILFISSGFASAAERFAVTGKLVNIRSGPGTNYDILWQAEKYYPINITKKSGSWYKFEDFEGDTGWIHKSLVGKIPAVITIKKECNIRSGPGLDFKIVFISEKGVPFKVIKRKGSWIHVQHSNGHEGWIYKTLVW